MSHTNRVRLGRPEIVTLAEGVSAGLFLAVVRNNLNLFYS